MAYWYTQFLAEQLHRDDLKDAELCVLAEIGHVLRSPDYREIKKPKFNEELMQRVRGHMRSDLKSRRSWLKKAAKESAEKGAVGKEVRLPDTRIESVYLRNFRSFGDGINTDESKQRGTVVDLVDSAKEVLKRIIVFGPNGSGKSSFCESLEWKITDFIGECDRRGMTLAKFCRRDSCSQEPEVTIRYNPHKVLSAEQKRLAKSCFIEKNRIQEFALLAKGKGDKDIIALLIGLDDLKTIADEIMVLPTSCNLLKESILLSDAESALETWNNANLTIEQKMKFEKEKEKEEGESLTSLLKVSDELCDTIQARKEKYEANISRCKEEREKIDGIRFFVVQKTDLADEFDEAVKCVAARRQLQERLAKQGANVSFKELYQALNALGSEGKTACPACDTPLANATKNPFEKATEELPKLKELQEIQDELKKNAETVSVIFQQIMGRLDELSANEISAIQRDTLALPRLHAICKAARGKYAPYIKPFSDSSDTETICDQLEKLIRFILLFSAKIGLEIDRYDTLRIALKQDKEKLEDSQTESTRKLVELTRSYEAWEKSVQTTKLSLHSYQQHLEQKNSLENAHRIENEKNAFLQECGKAYAAIYKRFLDFKHTLERERTEAIQARIAHYYQQINVGDSDAESVDSVIIQIPDETKKEYAILLNCNDGNQKDAMHILSEGHLRSLGLSIMLAIAEKYELPFLIFDDAVNAIDSDHRANIITMMFEDEYLCKVQLIVTTHDRLFWERFCLELGKNQVESTITGASFVVAYPSNRDGSVFAQYNVDFEHKITSALGCFDLRQAMIYLRIWLETEVLNYIDKKKESLSGKLHKSRRFRGNALEPDIKGMYTKVKSLLGKNAPDGNPLFSQDVKDAWDFLQTEVVDEILNQDNHAFSETMLNVSHGKTSDEVQEIFEKTKVVVTALQGAGKSSTVEVAIAAVHATTKSLTSDGEITVGRVGTPTSPTESKPREAEIEAPESV